MSGYPWRCTKCGTLTTDADAHLEQARHWEEPDFPLFLAQHRVDVARERVEVAQLALAEREAELARFDAGTNPARHGGTAARPDVRFTVDEAADAIEALRAEVSR